MSGRRARSLERTLALAPLAATLHPDVRFAILTTGRCGSELLVHALDGREDTRCDGELLGTPRPFPHAYVRGRVVAARLRGFPVYGFKLTAFTLVANPLVGAPEDYVRRLRDEGFRFVVLRRRDLLQHALSHIQARERQFHHRVDTAMPAWQPLHVDPVDLLAHMAHVELDTAVLDRCAAQVEHLTLEYEADLDVAGGVQLAGDRIADWLGIPRAPVPTTLRKITPRSCAEIVSNWQEVEAVLRTTRFADLLDADFSG